MTRVKVCGLRSPADLRAAEGADALGFVVASPTSKRNLEPGEAAALVRRAPPLVTTVMVTRETHPARLAALHGVVASDAVQVHGLREADEARAVRKALQAKLLLAVGIDGPASLLVAQALAPHADALVLDTGQGGTGRPHDWATSARIARAVDVPVLLAGGLTPANVAAAVRAVRPYAVDVSGGVEGPRGKSRAKVRAFLEAAHG